MASSAVNFPMISASFRSVVMSTDAGRTRCTYWDLPTPARPTFTRNFVIIDSPGFDIGQMQCASSAGAPSQVPQLCRCRLALSCLAQVLESLNSRLFQPPPSQVRSLARPVDSKDNAGQEHNCDYDSGVKIWFVHRVCSRAELFTTLILGNFAQSLTSSLFTQ